MKYLKNIVLVMVAAGSVLVSQIGDAQTIQQADIVKDQTWIHKLEAEIEEYKEAMTEKVEIIKDYQSKIFGAQEAIKALEELLDL